MKIVCAKETLEYFTPRMYVTNVSISSDVSSMANFPEGKSHLNNISWEGKEDSRLSVYAVNKINTNTMFAALPRSFFCDIFSENSLNLERSAYSHERGFL
jgi:hypothetical protein